MKIDKKNMPETFYRASRCCRVLGNPTAYLIIKCLANKKKSPKKISNELKISLPTISMTLRNLRNVDLVRYETKGKEKIYWIKDKDILDVILNLERYVDKMRFKKY